MNDKSIFTVIHELKNENAIIIQKVVLIMKKQQVALINTL